MQTKSKRVLGNILFFLGIFIGLGLATAPTWANFESVSYFFTGATYDSFRGLNCPNLMTRADKAEIVTATFNNPTNQELEPYYQVEMGGVIPRQLENQLTVPPHQAKRTQWTVSASDIEYGNFIFVKLTVLPDAYYSTSQATCGIMVLNIPLLSGGQVFALALTISLLGIATGLVLWELSNDKLATNFSAKLHARQALGIIVLLAMLVSFIGWWLAGVIFGTLAILLLMIILRQSIL